MHFDPDPVLPLVEFDSPGLTRNPKVPVMTTGLARKFALAPHHESPTAALPEGFFGAEPEIYFKHEVNLVAGMRCSGVGKTRRGCLSGMPARLVVAVLGVTRQGFGRRVRVLGMNCPPVCGGAGLASAFGLIRSLSALGA